MRPGFGDASRLFERDHVCRSLFHDTEAIAFQLTDDRCLPGTRSYGHDEPFHRVFHLWVMEFSDFGTLDGNRRKEGKFNGRCERMLTLCLDEWWRRRESN